MHAIEVNLEAKLAKMRETCVNLGALRLRGGCVHNYAVLLSSTN